MANSIFVLKKYVGKQTRLNENGKEDNNIQLPNRIILSVLGGAAVVLFALVVLVSTFVSLEEKYSKTGYYNPIVEQFSIRCDYLSLSPDEDFDLFNINKHKFTYSTHKDGYICTFRNVTEVILKFVQRVARLRLSLGLEGQPYLQCGNDSLKPASGHLTATFSRLSRHQKYKEEGLDQTIFWDKHSARAFIAENLRYHKGKVRVPEGRFYFVYSALHINTSNIIVKTRQEKNTQLNVFLRICVSSRGHEQTLLHKTNVYSPSKTVVTSSLNIGSYVYLAKDEDVYVKLSNPEALIHDSQGNSFGIFPLY